MLFHSWVVTIYECKCFKIILQNILCNDLECLFSGVHDHTWSLKCDINFSMLSSRMVSLNNSYWMRNCEGRGGSFQCVTLPGWYLTPMSSFSTASSFLLIYSRLAFLLWALDGTISCPSRSQVLSLSLPHCLWNFSVKSIFPSMIKSHDHLGQNLLCCSPFNVHKIVNTIYSASVLWIIFIAFFTWNPTKTSTPHHCLPHPHCTAAVTSWSHGPPKAGHYLQAPQITVARAISGPAVPPSPE